MFFQEVIGRIYFFEGNFQHIIIVGNSRSFSPVFPPESKRSKTDREGRRSETGFGFLTMKMETYRIHMKGIQCK